MWNRATIQVMWNRARIQVSICIKRWSQWDKRSNANLIALWEKCASEITFHTPMICELCSLRRKQVQNKKGWAKKRTWSKPQSEGKAWLAMSSSAMIWRKNDLWYEGKDPSHNLTQKGRYKSLWPRENAHIQMRRVCEESYASIHVVTLWRLNHSQPMTRIKGKPKKTRSW